MLSKSVFYSIYIPIIGVWRIEDEKNITNACKHNNLHRKNMDRYFCEKPIGK